ncbi:PAS domain-containing sensor histidine kinase [Bacteroides sp. 519]|uniref:sensor histidine kinase n=1 Tax=Bacteroides sp. 519 TaxID=2302937 RepID=UPI0013D363D4|nr:HAMP domain-containing sensor histidine kinase [Bacteroides sp. 519]NDV56609.1 sensor histidine kinase [Bacteroides sp. 519]
MKKYLRKSIRFIILIVLTSLFFAFLIAYKFYVAGFVFFWFLPLTAYFLLRHMEKGSKTMKQFVWSLSYGDFLTSHLTEKEQKDISPELATAIDDALENYKKRLQDKESKLQYFRALADHIDLAILVYSPDGIVEWINQAGQYQTGVRTPKTLDDFYSYHSELPARLRGLRPGDTSILQVSRGQETFQMVLSGISFVIAGKSLTVVSMKNIRSVLEDKETEAWQKLIRVLTHEIMNSMTPIVSLAELLKGKFSPDLNLSVDEQQELNYAVETIGRRGKSLITFVDNYRKVTGIPAPVMEVVSVKELLQGVWRLMDRDGLEIGLNIPTVYLQIIADRNQIEQVLINLIKNACEAMKDGTIPQIQLSAGINAQGYTFISVKDNGPGISSQVLEQIFIPFYTTKPFGSGIGLSVSRQIMYMHQGSLSVTSTVGEGSEFVLLFR